LESLLSGTAEQDVCAVLSASAPQDLEWRLETLAAIIEELCRGVEHSNKSVALPALSALGRFVFLYGRSLDGVTDPMLMRNHNGSSPLPPTMAHALAERILPVLLRILAENPLPSATAAPSETETAAEEGTTASSSLASAAMVALEMIMARLPSAYLLPLFLRLCLRNLNRSISGASAPSLALVTAQFCLECIAQLMPFSSSFFADASRE
jgi:hypothetical protein